MPAATKFIQAIAVCLAVAPAAVRGADSAPAPNFAEDIAPLLEAKCLECHSDGIRKGELSLATRADWLSGGDDGPAIVEGDSAKSHLIEKITGPDPDMPKNGEPLSASQIELIRQWIDAGAVWPDQLVLREPSAADKTWWAYQPISIPEPPRPDDIPGSWAESPIDRYIYAKLAATELSPNPPAAPRDLIRRLHYDVTGLPPTPEQADAFVKAWMKNADAAYAAEVDRLLASPHYGERWGRHWLDVVRFGESRGMERNLITDNIWPFRDYVIRSFNEDKPFDRFITEHLAGDVIAKDQPEVEVATAFLVAGIFDDVGNQDPQAAAQIRANTLDDIITATGSAFLGMTINCARCHDHKFDPILQADYYRLRAAFESVQMTARVVAPAADKKLHAARSKAAKAKVAALETKQKVLEQTIIDRTGKNADQWLPKVTHPKVDRTMTEDEFEPVTATAIRLVPLTNDRNPDGPGGVTIDEFEVFTDDPDPRNVALAANGGTASGSSRAVEDSADNAANAYGPALAIDGKFGRRWISSGNHILTITFAGPEKISRVAFSSDRPKDLPTHSKMVFPGEYRLEVSSDGTTWTEVANSWRREPLNKAYREQRLLRFGTTEAEKQTLAGIGGELGKARVELSAIKPLPTVWAGTFKQPDKPTHLARGGDPNKPAEAIAPASLSTFSEVAKGHQLALDAAESERRLQLAHSIVAADNPLPPRVLANRAWHYLFGTGIVSTPSDFGYMGGKPSHPELLDYLAHRLQRVHGWRLKPLIREILLSQSYRQSAQYRPAAATIDGDSRLLWRFPPRRLDAEEIRDTMLSLAGKLDTTMGGPGFRLYQFTQDNVCTYHPLDVHGPETYRRAVYHQNPRAAKMDLLTEFDCPDAAAVAPRRTATTTPLQALTLMNHQFTVDMANFFAERISAETDSEDPAAQVKRAFVLAFGRSPGKDELAAGLALIEQHGRSAFCRALLNANELIHVN